MKATSDTASQGFQAGQFNQAASQASKSNFN